VKFSEDIAVRPFPLARFALRDSTSGRIVRFLSAYDAPDSKLGHVLYADTTLIDAAKEELHRRRGGAAFKYTTLAPAKPPLDYRR
jgi:hypothetical protein